MAQFRGTVRGARGEASRLGHKTSGLTATCDAWNVGATCHANHQGDTDVISVTLDGGSNSSDAYGFVYLFKDPEGKPHVQLGIGTVKYLDINEDLIDRMVRDERWAKYLRGKLFTEGKVYEPA